MSRTKIIIMALLLVVLMTSTTEAGWLFFHESEVTGKILDIETKQPIEGALVVILYNKKTLENIIGDSYSTVIDIRETVTDKDGHFYFPSYTTVVQPFSCQADSTFIIFKAGYASIDKMELKGYLYGDDATEWESSWPYPKLRLLKYKTRPGIVELPKLTTKEQREVAMPSPIDGINYEKQKLLIHFLDEERKNLEPMGQSSKYKN